MVVRCKNLSQQLHTYGTMIKSCGEQRRQLMHHIASAKEELAEFQQAARKYQGQAESCMNHLKTCNRELTQHIRAHLAQLSRVYAQDLCSRRHMDHATRTINDLRAKAAHLEMSLVKMTTQKQALQLAVLLPQQQQAQAHLCLSQSLQLQRLRRTCEAQSQKMAWMQRKMGQDHATMKQFGPQLAAAHAQIAALKLAAVRSTHAEDVAQTLDIRPQQHHKIMRRQVQRNPLRVGTIDEQDELDQDTTWMDQPAAPATNPRKNRKKR